MRKTREFFHLFRERKTVDSKEKKFRLSFGFFRKNRPDAAAKFSIKKFPLIIDKKRKIRYNFERCTIN